MCVSCVRVVPCATVIQLSRTLFIAILIALDGEKAPKVSIAAYLVNPTLTEKKKKKSTIVRYMLLVLLICDLPETIDNM